MAYEKFITKNGKVYGPYVYHSRRIDGKVVSEYCGPNGKSVKSSVKKKSVKKFVPKNESFPPKRQISRSGEIPRGRLFVIIGISIVLLIILGIFAFSSQLTGKSIVEFQGAVVSDKLIGNLGLTILGGELIPADSKLIINNENLSYEFLLGDLINSDTIVGEFFLSGSSLNGVGEGFGLIGKKEEISEITFEILIETESESSSPSEEKPIINETVVEENKTIEDVAENESIEEEPIAEEPVEENIEEELVPEPIAEEPVEENIEEEVLEEEVAAPLTGNVILGESRGFGGFIRSIFTGRVVDDSNVIKGSVSSEKEFTYNLPEGATATIVKGSVKSLGENLSESDLDLVVEDGVLKITSDYSKVEFGFGKEYLTTEKKTFNINLDSEEIDLVEGDLEVLVIFNSTEIVNYKTKISKNDSVEIEKNKTVIDLAEEIFNETNNTIESNFVNISLTEEEKVVLRREFKMIIVETLASDYKDKVLVDFKLGSRSMNNSYDSSLPDSKLKELIDKDRIIWLKDLARELSSSKTVIKKRESLSSLYPVM